MSYRTWHVYGYGVCMTNLNTTIEKIEKLLEKAPNLRLRIHKWFRKEGITEPTIFDYDRYYGYGYNRAEFLSEIIQEAEDVLLDYAEDFNEDVFLLYAQRYPWNLSEKEKEFTEDSVKEMFQKYLTLFTDDNFEIDYYEVENGG